MPNLNTNLLSVAQSSSQLNSGPNIEENSSAAINKENLATSLEDEDQARLDIGQLIEQQLNIYNIFSHIIAKDPAVADKMLALFKSFLQRL